MKPYSMAFKVKMVRRMTGREAMSARQLGHETGVAQQSLSRWLQDARSLSDVTRRNHTKREAKKWSVEEKARVVARAAELSGDQLAEFLEDEGLILGQLEQWRLALEDEGYADKAVRRRIGKLERELARKEKALAETAALLVLQKKVEDLWEAEDDVTDGSNEK
jgi:transposase